MIKFFRKIRKKLLSENKFSKYLFYAIGEIVLVVLGILIALSINNWNEKKKLKSEEINILSNFKNTLELDLISIESSIILNDKARNSMDLLIEHFNNNLPYSDSLKHHFGYTNMTWTKSLDRSVFESLKSKGVNLISNENIRQNLIRLYGEDETFRRENGKIYRDVIEDASRNLYSSRFEDFWSTNYGAWVDFTQNLREVKSIELQREMIPIDFEKLKNDSEYLYFLKTLKNKNSFLMDYGLKANKASIIKLIEDIEFELNQISRK